MLLKASFNRHINKYSALEALMYFLQVIFPLRNNIITIPVSLLLLWGKTHAYENQDWPDHLR